MLWEYAKAQEFTNSELSNFITTVGAFASLSLTLGLTTTLDDLKAISMIVGDIAKKNLDSAQQDALAQQAADYGPDDMTVEEARAELEKMGIATKDAILQVTDNLVFMTRTLRIASNSFENLGVGLLDAIKFTQQFLEKVGGLEKWEEVVSTYYQNFFTQQEQFKILTEDLTAAFAQHNAVLPTTREGYRALVEAVVSMGSAGETAYIALMQLAPMASAYYDGIEQQAQNAIQSAENVSQILAQAQNNLDAYGLTDFEKQMQSVNDSFINMVSSLVEAGASLSDLQQLIDIFDTTSALEYQKALDSVNESFEAGLNAISDRRTTITNKILELTAPETLNDVQLQRAKASFAELEADQLNEQLEQVDEIYQLTLQKYEVERQSITDIIDAVKSIRKYTSGLLVDERLSPLSNEQRLIAARSQFSTQLSAAQAGDVDAMKNITQFADEYLTESRSFYGPTVEYASIFKNVTDALDSIEAPDAEDYAAQTANATQTLVSELQVVSSLLDSIEAGQAAAKIEQIDAINDQSSTLRNAFLQVVKKLAPAVSGAESIGSDTLDKLLLLGFDQAAIDQIATVRGEVVNRMNALLAAGMIDQSSISTLIEAHNVMGEALLHMVEAQAVLPENAAFLYTESSNLFFQLTDAIEAGIWTPEQASLIATSSSELFSSLAKGITTDVWTEENAALISSSATTLWTRLYEGVTAGTWTADNAAVISTSSNNLWTTIVDGINSGVFASENAGVLSESVTHLWNTLIESVDNGQLSLENAASIGDSVSELWYSMLSGISEGIWTSEQTGIIMDASNGLLSSITSVLLENSFSDTNKEILSTSIAQLFSNLNDILSIQSLSDANKASITAGFDDFTVLLSSYLSSTTLNDTQKTIIAQGFTNLANSLKTALGTSGLTVDDMGKVTAGFSSIANALSIALSSYDLSANDISLLTSGITQLSQNAQYAIAAIDLSPEQINTISYGFGAAANNVALDLASLGLTDNQKSLIQQGVALFAKSLIPTVGPATPAELYDATLPTVTLPKFANGGITNTPSIFGDAGWEAAVPLPDGRSIPVTVSQSPSDNKETNEQLEKIVSTLIKGIEANAKGQAALKAELKESHTQVRNLTRKIELLGQS